MANKKKNDKKPTPRTAAKPATATNGDKDPLSAANVAERFKARVNRSADGIRAVAKAERWVAEHKLDPQAVPKALSYLDSVIKEVQKPEKTGFQL